MPTLSYWSYITSYLSAPSALYARWPVMRPHAGFSARGGADYRPKRTGVRTSVNPTVQTVRSTAHDPRQPRQTATETTALVARSKRSVCQARRTTPTEADHRTLGAGHDAARGDTRYRALGSEVNHRTPNQVISHGENHLLPSRNFRAIRAGSTNPDSPIFHRFGNRLLSRFCFSFLQ